MVECGRGAGLEPEAFRRLRRLLLTAGQELQRDMPAEREVLSFVNDTHASGTEAMQDAVVRNLAAFEGAHAARAANGMPKLLRRNPADQPLAGASIQLEIPGEKARLRTRIPHAADVLQRAAATRGRTLPDHVEGALFEVDLLLRDRAERA